MKKIPAGAFTVHKHGKSVAKLVPVKKDTGEIYDFLGGKGAIRGDVVSPALSSEEWGEPE